MYLRFSKGKFKQEQKYIKSVFLEDTLVMEYGDAIVGIAKLHQETERCMDYDIVVASKCSIGASYIARSIKNTIGKSNKFTDNPNKKRRKYFVESRDCESLPIKAQIKLTIQ